MSHVSLIFFLLVFVLESSDRVQNLVSSLADGDGSHGSSSDRVDSSSEGVDLTEEEPGQGSEDEVEQVLANVDHDVLVLEDSLLDNLTERRTKFSSKIHQKYFSK